MSSIIFKDVYKSFGSFEVLFELLKEREKKINISHRRMPSWAEHTKFVRSKPYKFWRLILNKAGETVGAVYLSKMNEIGLFIFKKYRGKGYGKKALKAVLSSARGQRLLANVNPKNRGSIDFFKSAGFKHIQNTYEFYPSGGKK